MISAASPFRPFPRFAPHPLAPGGHLQTILGLYLPSVRRSRRSRRILVPLADGDRLVLHDDCPAGWRPGDRAVMMIHGLGGGHNSGYMARIAGKLLDIGVRSFRLDQRGCGAGVRLAQHPFHAGRSDDALAALEVVERLCPQSPIALVGFSMGGNIALKLAGEPQHRRLQQVDRVIAVAPPIDLTYCAQNLRDPHNRLYDRSFVRTLKKHIARRSRLAPAAPRIDAPRPVRCLYDFDDCITAPLSGYPSAAEYYLDASAASRLAQVAWPTLIIVAADDPLIPLAMFEQVDMSPAVELRVTASGGHLGYLGRAGVDADIRWLDWRIVEQMTEEAP